MVVARRKRRYDRFSSKNGADNVNYNAYRAGIASKSDLPFAFRDGKLGIKGGMTYSATEFHFLPSFEWAQRGKSFKVLAQEWFPLASSLNMYYTFTKLP
jgi:hypothetical protein